LKSSFIPGLHCGAAEGPVSPSGAAQVAQRAGTSKNKKEKDVKLNTRSLGCLATFALLFAVSTPAQRIKFPEKYYPKVGASSDASAAGKSEGKKKSNATPASTDACTYSFHSGTGPTYLQFCVTVNGNLANFDSPNGVEQLDQNGSFEGYGICDATEDVGYYDYGGQGDSGNWNPSTKVSSTATSVKIERSTSDGAWLLTQTISSVAGTNPYAKIAMALKNTSAVTKVVELYRFGNADPDDAAALDNYSENYDATYDSTWGYTPFDNPTTPYGLMLQNVGNPTPASVPYDRNGLVITGTDGPTDPCSWSSSPTIYGADGSLIYLYLFELNKEQTVTITDRYISF
jgi:hypothetical protein